MVGEIPQEPLRFQLRAGLLAQLDALLPGQGRGPMVHAVTGMRGAGKTQLAAACARARLADRWRLVAWINAGDAPSLRGGLAVGAAKLELDGGAGDVAEAGQAVRHWLEAEGDRCLLVFDNAADPQDLLSFIPAAGQARVVITSTEQSMARLGASVAVDVFTEGEGLEFLAARTGSADTESARVLASELGRLPLALAQAAAVIADQHLDYQTVDEALGRLAGCSLLTFSGDGGTVTAHRLVMRIILERLALQGRLAEVCLVAAVALEDLTRRRVAWRDRAGRHDLVEQIMITHEHCASFRGDVASVLTQATLRLRLWAVKCLNELGDSVDQAILIAEPLLGAMEQISGSGDPDTMAARNNLAIAYQRAGRPAEAAPLFECTLADRERVLGSDHPDTLNSRDNLAAAYQQAGRPAEAITLHERALAGMERVLAPDDPEVARVLLNLGGVQQQLGRLTDAHTSFNRALAICEGRFGPAHPEVASALTSLGGVQLQLWEPAAARASFERALAITEAADPDSAEAARALVGLSGIQRRLWELDEARAGLERALAIFQKVFGSEHPEIAPALINLAAVQMRQGELKEAHAGLERALAALERTYGPDHPGLAATLINLGAVQLAMWARAEACASLERAWTISEAAYGPNHPDVASVLINLGIVQLQMGKLNEPCFSLKRALTISETLYGADHPEVASALVNLGGVQRRMWKLEEARVSLERALTIGEAVYGPGHPMVAFLLVNLGAIQLELGAQRVPVPALSALWRSAGRPTVLTIRSARRSTVLTIPRSPRS